MASQTCQKTVKITTKGTDKDMQGNILPKICSVTIKMQFKT